MIRLAYDHIELRHEFLRDNYSHEYFFGHKTTTCCLLLDVFVSYPYITLINIGI